MSREQPLAEEYAPGDRVRVDIPDETHPDHDRYHGNHGYVIAVLPSTAGDGPSVGGPRVRVEFDGGGYADFGLAFLRPPIVR